MDMRCKSVCALAPSELHEMHVTKHLKRKYFFCFVFLYFCIYRKRFSISLFGLKSRPSYAEIYKPCNHVNAIEWPRIWHGSTMGKHKTFNVHVPKWIRWEFLIENVYEEKMKKKKLTESKGKKYTFWVKRIRKDDQINCSPFVSPEWCIRHNTAPCRQLCYNFLVNVFFIYSSSFFSVEKNTIIFRLLCVLTSCSA